MEIRQNISLKPFNTFGLEAKASHFVDVTTVEELKTLFGDEQWKEKPRLILGGGSNILLTGDFDGIAIKNSIKGIEKIAEDVDSITIKIGGGEIWHDLVLHCIDNDWAGIENMSLIPGTVGAAPMQNIGAYGMELKEVFTELEALNITTLAIEKFNKQDCQFGYRWSVFKGEKKGRYLITSVTLKLSKTPNINTDYGDIKHTLEEAGITEPTIRDVSNAVIKIRQSKLPDPAEIGNSGSFFKNPEIPEAQFEKAKAKHPNMVGYPTTPGMIKVPAGWLIDNAGWKGKRFGEIGVHAKQALVLVNYGSGKGADLVQLAKDIQKDVKEKYGIDIQPEVNII